RKMLMATQSRFVPDSILKTKVDTVGSRAAIAGQTGSAVYPNYRGVPVLGYYTWVPELNAALLSEIETAEAFAAVTRLRWTIVAVVGVALVLVLAASLLLSRGLTQQVSKIMSAFSQIGMGNFDARAEVTSQDEIGEMAISLNAMLDNTLALIQSREERDQ